MRVVAKNLPAPGLGSVQGLRLGWVHAVLCTLVAACVAVGGQALVPGPAVLCDVGHSPVVGLSPCNLTVSCAALPLLKTHPACLRLLPSEREHSLKGLGLKESLHIQQAQL